jgi:hypothetical protein
MTEEGRIVRKVKIDGKILSIDDFGKCTKKDMRMKAHKEGKIEECCANCFYLGEDRWLLGRLGVGEEGDPGAFEARECRAKLGGQGRQFVNAKYINERTCSHCIVDDEELANVNY